MVVPTTASAIEGHLITAYKGAAQGLTFDGLLRHAESLCATSSRGGSLRTSQVSDW